MTAPPADGARSVLVIGGSGGLGSAIARAVAADWGRVVVSYRTGEAAARAVAESLAGKGTTVACDLGDAASVATAIAAADAPDFGGGAVGRIVVDENHLPGDAGKQRLQPSHQLPDVGDLVKG